MASIKTLLDINTSLTKSTCLLRKVGDLCCGSPAPGSDHSHQVWPNVSCALDVSLGGTQAQRFWPEPFLGGACCVPTAPSEAVLCVSLSDSQTGCGRGLRPSAHLCSISDGYCLGPSPTGAVNDPGPSGPFAFVTWAAAQELFSSMFPCARGQRVYCL